MQERESEYKDFFEKYTDEWFLDLYFKHGSVEEAIKKSEHSLPISTANFHRLVRNRGIVKNNGRKEANLAHTLRFFSMMAKDPTIALERLYFSQLPASFRVSVPTLHRIYRRIIQKDPERSATALLIKKSDDETKILIGREETTNWVYAKHAGDLSIPMSFSKKGEDPYLSILRVLQSEVSTRLAISGRLSIGGELSNQIIYPGIKPVMNFKILDVEVGVYSLCLPSEIETSSFFSSHRIAGHKYLSCEEVMNTEKVRAGVKEIISGYFGNEKFVTSEVNRSLLLAV